MPDFATARGRPLPLGASRAPDGVNFAVLSRHATAVTLVLFPDGPGSTPLATFPLDARRNRTGDHWHVRVEGLPEVLTPIGALRCVRCVRFGGRGGVGCSPVFSDGKQGCRARMGGRQWQTWQHAGCS